MIQLSRSILHRDARTAVRVPRRGFAMIAVMIVLGSAMFITAALLYVLHADAATSAGLRSADQSRMLLRSGLSLLVHDLDGQRDVILEGESPRIESQYVVFEGENRLGVIRLLPVTPDGLLLGPEAGKIDLNHVDADGLERSGLIDRDVAERIIALRDGVLRRPLQSVEELLAIDEVTPSMLYGPLDEIFLFDDVRGFDDGRFAAERYDQTPRGLADILTVFAFEPALQRNGRLKINLNVEWSDDLHRRIAERFNEQLAGGVRQILRDSDFRFTSDTRFFELLLFFEPNNPGEWVEYVDAFSFEHHDYLAGRLDFNTASYEALLSLPGMSEEQAASIVGARSGLSPEDRATLVWPALQGFVEPAQYRELGGRVTNRCWNWRVRIAAGTVAADDPDGSMDRPVVFEAVIDLSAPRARIAYLRDITQFQPAAFMAVAAPEPDEESWWRESEGEYGAAGGSAEIADYASDNPNSDDDGGSSGPRPPRTLDYDDWPRRDRPAGASRTPDQPRPMSEPPRRIGRWKPG